MATSLTALRDLPQRNVCRGPAIVVFNFPCDLVDFHHDTGIGEAIPPKAFLHETSSLQQSRNLRPLSDPLLAVGPCIRPTVIHGGHRYRNSISHRKTPWRQIGVGSTRRAIEVCQITIAGPIASQPSLITNCYRLLPFSSARRAIRGRYTLASWRSTQPVTTATRRFLFNPLHATGANITFGAPNGIWPVTPTRPTTGVSPDAAGRRRPGCRELRSTRRCSTRIVDIHPLDNRDGFDGCHSLRFYNRTVAQAADGAVGDDPVHAPGGFSHFIPIRTI